MTRSLNIKKDLGRFEILEKRDITKEDFVLEIEKWMTFEKRFSATNIHALIERVRRILYHYNVKMPCPEDAIRIEEDLKARGNKNNTIRQYLRALELMSEYQGVPMKLKKPKTTFKLPEMLTLAECRALAAAATNKRDKAIITLLLYTGMRNAELVKLDLQDLDQRKRTLYIKDPKNRHDRRAVLTMECAQVLNEWIKARPDVEVQSLFITQYGKRLSKERLVRVIQESAKRGGIQKRVYPHLLRHTCASMMLRSGIPITEVALQLGHRSLNSTMVYLHGDVEGLKEDIDKKFKY